MPVSITVIIIIATLIVSIQGFNSKDFLYRMSFSPYQVKHSGKKYKFFTHMFVHADWMHLIFNLISFYLFGDLFEQILIDKYGLFVGELHFLVIYFLGGLFATLWPMIRNHDNPGYTSLGASGAVSSIIFATIMWIPDLPMGLIFLPIMIPAFIFGPLYLAFEFWSLKRGKSNIAHDAHIGGAIFGVVYILIINIDKGKELFIVIKEYFV